MGIHNRELVVLLQIEMNIYNNVEIMKLVQMTMVLAITKPLNILRTWTKSLHPHQVDRVSMMDTKCLIF